MSLSPQGAAGGSPEPFALPSVLSIAGSDSSGGAGIQADIKTIQALGLFAETAITAITAQNTLGVTAVENISPAVVEAQIDAVFADIRPAAVKVGMVSSPELAEAIARALERNGAENIVVDPVLVATSGSALAESGVVDALRSALMPLATVATPNLAEATALSGVGIATSLDAIRAGQQLAGQCKTAVLVKGGHGLWGPAREGRTEDAADDVLVHPDGSLQWFYANRVSNPNTHGTGCTLSSAIASYLAQGESLPRAIACAKEYLTGAIGAQLDLGGGSGPLDHFWQMRLRPCDSPDRSA